jgi:hypothetical protein
MIDADVGRKPLDAGVSHALHVPFALGGARLGVLTDDRVLNRLIARSRSRARGVEAEGDQEQKAQDHEEK